MSADLRAILRLEVPVIVLLGTRSMRLGDVTGLAAGAIIEIPKNAEDELELCVNNKVVGLGKAVKVGENFGIRITFIGDVRKRIEALAGGGDAGRPPPASESVEQPAAAGATGTGVADEQPVLAGQA
ncbi:MAG: FliM/FliN family flagellar motor switch protein [Phycisphaerales bacterium]